jgi:hydrogenase/urease accessory protein HupE
VSERQSHLGLLELNRPGFAGGSLAWVTPPTEGSFSAASSFSVYFIEIFYRDILAGLVAGMAGLTLQNTKRVSGSALLAGFALAGLFHGHAFAEAVIGAEATPIIAYLAGLAVIQGALLLDAMALNRQAARASWLRPAMGAAASLAGVGFLVGAVVG